MFAALIELSLRRRWLVVFAAAAFLAYGLHRLRDARLDVLPDFAPPQIAVQTEAPGRSAEQVELEVTRAVESAVRGVPGIAAVRSESIQGLSVVHVVFAEDVDPWRCRQSVAEQLAPAAAHLPDGVAAPQLTPLMSATMDLLKIGLLPPPTADGAPADLAALRELAAWRLKPLLLAVPGVAGVSVFGGDDARLTVAVQPTRLAAAHATLTDVLTAVRRETATAGAGFVEAGGQRLAVQVDGAARTAEALADAAVQDGVRVRDVATVAMAPAPRFGDCLIQGRRGVLLTTTTQFGANTLEVTQAVERVLADFAPALQSAHVELLPRLHRPATFVERALANLRASAGWGALLVAVVLLLFLRDLRTALVSLTAIPLSLLAAVVVLTRLGYALDTMALGGLAMAIGEVVDDAIVDVENVVRRHRAAAAAGAPVDPFALVLAAAVEVRSAVVHATLVVGILFVPVLTMGGLAGRLFLPLGLAYLLAVGASLAVAVLVTPPLCLLLLRAPRGPERTPLSARLVDAVVARLLPHPGPVAAALLLLAVGAASLALGLHGEFVPPFREGHFVLQGRLLPGTSLAETARLGERISRALLAMPAVATVEQQIGRVELGEDTWGPERCEFHVELRPLPGAEEAAAQQQFEQVLDEVPGLHGEVLTFLGDRISETITGEAQDVVVTITGDDLDALDEAAQAVVQRLERIPGHGTVVAEAPTGAPTLTVTPRRDVLRSLGLRAADVGETLTAACQGLVVATLPGAQRPLDVVVRVDDAGADVPERLAALPVALAGGRTVPLAQLADVQTGNGRALIQHEAGRRRQVVACNVEGRDLDAFVADVTGALAPLRQRADLHFHVGGKAEERATAAASLGGQTLLAGLAALAVLLAALRRVRLVLLVLLNLPFAYVGAVAALWACGRALDMGALVGFVTLFGITARNALLLLAHGARLVETEGLPWDADTVRRAVRERTRPILMTALVTGLALLPIALGRDEAGREIEGPMALVLLGGLCSSTLLNLLALPTFALHFARLGRR